MPRTYINTEEVKSSNPSEFSNLKEQLNNLSQLKQTITGMDENTAANAQLISDIQLNLSNYNFDNMIARIEEVEKINIKIPTVSQSTEKVITYNEDIIKTYTVNFTVKDANLTEYNATLNAVNENDYTVESWNIYQSIINDNIVTVDSTEEEVTSAISIISEAQNDLVFKDLETLNTTIENANSAKTDVEISTDGTDVLVGTDWVTQEVNDTLDQAIAMASTEKETNQEILDAITMLNNAIDIYNAEKKSGTFVPDETAPVITSSDETVDISNLSEWTETVSATDDNDGDITSDIVKTYYESDGITPLDNLASAKEYIGDATNNTSFVIKYNVTDAAGNEAIEKVVTITVEPAVINVTGVTLDNPTLTLVEGEATGKITETIFPSDATDKTVTWTSSDETVATVVDGVVTPLLVGTTTITVTTTDGGFTATSEVTVEAALNSNSNVLSFNQELSNETVLNDLTIDDVTIDNFDPNTFEYNVALESGTNTIPQINGTPSDKVTDMTITQAENLPGTAIIVITTKDETIESEEVTGDLNYRIEYGYDVNQNKISEKYFQEGIEIASKTFTYSNGKLSSVSSVNADKFQLVHNDNITDNLRDKIATLEELNISDRLDSLESRMLLENEFETFTDILKSYEERMQTLEQFLINNIEEIYDVATINEKISLLESKVFEGGYVTDEFNYTGENSDYTLSRIINDTDRVRVELDGIELSEGIDNDYSIDENILTIFTKAIRDSKITVEIY